METLSPPEAAGVAQFTTDANEYPGAGAVACSTEELSARTPHSEQAGYAYRCVW